MKTWYLAGLLVLALAGPALAHCDTEDGPVAKAGRRALEESRVELALIWVQPSGEAEVRSAFARAAQGTDSQAQETRSFLETLVRVHRAGEGETYTGIKPSGTAIPAPVAALDRALEARDPQGLEAEVRAAYDRLAPLLDFEPTDLQAGRKFVAAYVEAVHRLEGSSHEGGGHESPGCCPPGH